MVAGFFMLAVIFGALTDDEATSTTPLELGGCYDSADLAQANRVNCSLPHRVQVFAQIQANGNLGDAVDQCFAEAISLRDSGTIPDGSTVPEGTFVAAVDAPAGGGGNTLCYFEAGAAGLVGSVLPE